MSSDTQTVVLRVVMSCGGCVGAVKKVLGKLEGVESFDIDQNDQKVTVKGRVTPDIVLQTVSKTGKKTSLWKDEAPAKPDDKPSEADASAGDVSKAVKEISLGEEKGGVEPDAAKPSDGDVKGDAETDAKSSEAVATA